jgi:hypothetical protein
MPHLFERRIQKRGATVRLSVIYLLMKRCGKQQKPYLAAGHGKEAAVEFQKILAHSGIVWNCWTGALAHLGMARADALQAKASQG